jgi:dihydroxyacid dehydratase/phosphogluconate dehydratase
VANAPTPAEVAALDDSALFQCLLRAGTLKVVVVISGQGPEAFGMPEMFTPMQHINANRVLKKTTVLISDGRYSGVTYGAAIGHVTPEALNGGGILYLQTGDLLQLGFRRRRLELLDRAALAAEGRPLAYRGDLAGERAALGQARQARLRRRQRLVAAPNRQEFCTDAAHGVVPLAVWRELEADRPLSGS